MNWRNRATGESIHQTHFLLHWKCLMNSISEFYEFFPAAQAKWSKMNPAKAFLKSDKEMRLELNAPS